MILTVTLNPSVDISYHMGNFQTGAVNRVTAISKTAGGKGLNVTRVLHMLGDSVMATGFLGGALGDFIKHELVKAGIEESFVSISNPTRNCIAIIHDRIQTEILESGPVINETEFNCFLENYKKLLIDTEIVTLSGSLPSGLPRETYQLLIQAANEAKQFVLLDTNGDLLKAALEGEDKPFLIKPNKEELEDLIGEELDRDKILDVLTSNKFDGIEWVVVTLGKEGAVIKHKDSIFLGTPPVIDAVNPVGSGDSVLAGFASGLQNELAEIDLIKHGLSMGVLNAMEERTGHIDARKIEWCKEQVEVVPLNGTAKEKASLSTKRL